MLAVAVMERAEDAATLLKPEHQKLLDLLSTPNSASGLARDLGWSRQIVNYHLKELEHAGCIVLQEERKRGNCIERVMRRTAAAYLIGPQTLGSLSADPARVADKLSAAYLIAVAGRTIREVSRMGRAAEKAGKTLPTLTLDTEIRFRSAGERQAFTAEFTAQAAALVRKYHDDKSPNGRRFRVVTGAYPLISTNTERGSEGNGTNDDGNAAA